MKTIINQTDIRKFSFAEAMSNSNGKTSGSHLAGFITVVTSCIVFLISSIAALYDKPDGVAIAGLATASIAVGLGLFGYSKKNATKDSTNETISSSNE